MLSSNNMVLNRVLFRYTRLAEASISGRKWDEMNEAELWFELCLCILSSNVPFELAQSSLIHLRDLNYLDPNLILESEDSTQRIAYELSREIYLPLRKDGTRRKYRFPRMRAQNITCAVLSLYRDGNGIREILCDAHSEIDLRNHLMALVSGVGMKQASHFLRNIGYSSKLAIIDTHVLEFLRQVAGIPIDRSQSITRATYLRLESVLSELCALLGVDLSLFDSAIWHYMRGN